ncbi:protein MTSS 2 isoform X4 [Bombus vosnesenskii]|uniref:Protein MTSS 2 isoform X4 n=3 Tax=Pyrobombus TaxID=144703 RepID=A0A6J3KHJ3_9HYME|nr:protein MTSS 2 isoform X4 [Bombus impatiens]XP_033193765.1 protein MTSS 2 isoform X4 [Bombus vancouverensis nearcticus]XP_033307915.1 protein MTSS 2 isoform X4 [Bombus bifarius]XP_033352662.1 protein MTSS 2 isoform X4 [Bombus vosnesenskii]XP_050486703.1 protein MTSS 2 isoform X3 [Bombus huntii]
MDATIERECSALGGLFQQIITDMKNGAPLWEDLISKATKLHSCLRAAILAISAYLETFQKIADAATSARGATKEIGTALTRICLRHKAVETRMKSFTSAIMDCLVLPLQEKLEDWKKSLINLDKEHAKEYKKAKAELRKRSTDTLRLQKKKARKGHHLQGQTQGHGTLSGDIELNRMLESSAAVVQEKRLSLEETERKAVRAALLEERGRYCLLARFLKPVLDEEIAMLMELTHLQEVSDQLQRHAASPHHLPPASEQVITDIKGCDVTQWSLATPPSSPSLSLGSRKSSMCSISSLTSSSSGSCKSHPSPSGHPWHRSLSQETSVQYDRQNQNTINERPHTISSAYEKGHQRPALSVYTFQAPDNSSCCHSQPASPVSSSSSCSSSNQQASRVQLRRNNGSHRPPIPNRCSSLERPTVPVKNEPPGSPRGKPKLPLPAHLAKELATHQLQQPMYVNMHELANLAASRAQEMQLPLPPPPASLSAPGTEKTEITEKDGGSQTSESSIESSSGYGSQTTIPHSHSLHNPTENAWNVPGAVSTLTVRRGSMQQVNKPPPPTRRTSTIITATFNNPSAGSNDERTDNTCDETENLPPPPAFLLEGSSPTASPTPQRSISVSETVRTLTELRHTPASPSLLRKATGQAQSHNNASATLPHNAVLQVTRSSVERSCAAIRSASQERNSNTTQITTVNTGVNIQGQGPGGVGQSFMAVLSAKLINSTGNNATSGNNTNSSPKSTRKHSIEQQISKNSKTPSGFLETLNAKLAQQQQNLQGNNTTSRSASVRRIMGNRVPIMDPLQVRDSLMDQIRKGTSLRKTSGPINDRSAPKIY